MKFRSLAAALLLTVLHVPAQAAFSSLGILGDSLSDTGRLAQATSGATFGLFSVASAPYFPGHFSNGPVWVEYYAATHPGINIGNAAMGGAFSGVIPPDLGRTPSGISSGRATDLTAATIDFNNDLVNLVAGAGAKVRPVDLFTPFNALLANAGAVGYTDTTPP